MSLSAITWALATGASAPAPPRPTTPPRHVVTELSTAASDHAAHAGLPASLTYAVERNTPYDNSITRWNPCTPIRWQINLHGAPIGALAVATQAIHRVAMATGMHFTFTGTTTAIPQSSWGSGPQNPPLTIAWARPGHGHGRSDLLPGGQTVGMGGTRSAGSTTDGVHWNFHIATGYVVLDATASRSFPANFAAQPSLGGLLMHELGHAVGLGHAGDPNEIMYPSTVPGRPSTWGTGDRTALHLVGAAAGCIPTL